MLEKLHLVPDQASSVAAEVDALYFWLVGVSVFFATLIGLAIVFFAIRYRRRAADEVGGSFHASTALEITWTVVPLAIVLFTFGWGAKLYLSLSRPPAEAEEYFVVGKQWMWKIQHPEGIREINELHVPVGQTIKLTMTSEDVIHSFFIPAFRVKADVLPGRYTYIWFTATRPGRYHLFCTEYCGAEHSQMVGWVEVMEPENYQTWLAGGPAPRSLVAAGEQLFVTLACATCHRPGAEARGPLLDRLYGSEVELVGGRRATVDDTYLRESIMRPAAKVVAGYQPIMPTYQGQISEEGLLQLISYLKSLAPPPPAGPSSAGAPAPAAIEAPALSKAVAPAPAAAAQPSNPPPGAASSAAPRNSR